MEPVSFWAFINSFITNVSILYSLKLPENPRFASFILLGKKWGY